VMGSYVRHGRVYTPDEAGRVRYNVIYRTFPAAPGLSPQGPPPRGNVRHRFSIMPVVAMEAAREEFEAAADEFERDPAVLAVEPEVEQHALAAQAIPWGVFRIQAPEVQALGNRGTGVNVAILDSGLDYTHPDLASNYRGGYDFVNNDGDPFDDYGHGTWVSGVVAAADNAFGVVGVAPGANLYALKVLNNRGTGYDTDFARAVEWCISHGIKVINYSAGGRVATTVLQQACQAAYNAGIVVVAAAGNDSDLGAMPPYIAPLEYPAAYSTVVSVGATNELDRVADFSNQGASLTLTAPGVNITSTGRGGVYVNGLDGTSFAAPHVTGTVALLVESGVTAPADIFRRLEQTADDLGTTGRDNTYGFGLVNARRASFFYSFLQTPNGGEILPSGSETIIQWIPQPGAETYDLSLSMDGGQTWSDIASGVAGTGFPWTVPSPPNNRRNCLVRVVAYTQAHVDVAESRSGAPFTIEVIKVTRPGEGMAWRAGRSKLITWTFNSTAAPVASIELTFTKNGGLVWKPMAILPPDAVSYLWLIPSVPMLKTDCRVKVRLVDAGGASVGRATSGLFTLGP
jgi:subtilisin